MAERPLEFIDDDLRGVVFGRLHVLRRLHPDTTPDRRAKRWWVCICACGNFRSTTSYQLLSGQATSCIERVCTRIPVSTTYRGRLIPRRRPGRGVLQFIPKRLRTMKLGLVEQIEISAAELRKKRSR